MQKRRENVSFVTEFLWILYTWLGDLTSVGRISFNQVDRLSNQLAQLNKTTQELREEVSAMAEFVGRVVPGQGELSGAMATTGMLCTEVLAKQARVLERVEAVQKKVKLS